MKGKPLIPALCAAMLLSSTAWSDETGIYAGFGGGFANYQYEGSPGIDMRFWHATGRVGARINEYISGEARISKGLRNVETEYVGFDVESSLDYVAGAYIKLGAGERVHPYALLGFNKLSMTVAASNGVATLAGKAIDHDVAYGIGVDLPLNDKAFFSVECASYYDEDTESLQGCSGSLVLKFR